MHKTGLDENLYDDAPDTAAASYGSASFESPWDGGIDVRVLDPQRFKTSEGRLGRRLFAFEKERQRETLYWHCACCGDSVRPVPPLVLDPPHSLSLPYRLSALLLSLHDIV